MADMGAAPSFAGGSLSGLEGAEAVWRCDASRCKRRRAQQTRLDEREGLLLAALRSCREEPEEAPDRGPLYAYDGAELAS